MKRLLAVLVGAGIAVGGGAAAWAGTSGPGGANKEAAKACAAQAKATQPDADKATRRAAVKTCLEAQGITPGHHGQPTAEQQAKRDAVRACLQGVKAANPGATKADLRDKAATCLQQAGVDPAKVRVKVGAAKACLATARADHPDATRAELRSAVKACVQAGA